MCFMLTTPVMVLQFVSGFPAFLSFKPSDNAFLDSLGCEWLPCVAMFNPADDTCQWFTRM